MEPLSTFFGSNLARVAITKVFNALWDEANTRLNPDEMVSALQQAELAADAAYSELGGLFRRIDRDGANGYQKFLKFFQSGEVLKELQKPDKPNVNILVEAFKRSVSEHPEAEDYLSDLMPLWMETFVESYFEQTKGICFQVAKEQYLKQLAQRVNDVKFVGIAVSDSDIEQPEILAKIFVMPDVREEKRNFSETKTFFTYFQPIRLMRIMDGNTGEEISITQIPEQTSNYKTQLSATRNNICEEEKLWAMRD